MSRDGDVSWGMIGGWGKLISYGHSYRHVRKRVHERPSPRADNRKSVTTSTLSRLPFGGLAEARSAPCADENSNRMSERADKWKSCTGELRERGRQCGSVAHWHTTPLFSHPYPCVCFLLALANTGRLSCASQWLESELSSCRENLSMTALYGAH